MASRRFDFAESWTLGASPQEVRDVLVDLERYPQWWPQVRAVAKLGEDDARVLCRAALPYTLDLRLHAVSRDLPTVEVELSGGLEGWAAWTLTPTLDGTRLDFAQEVELTAVPAWIVSLSRPLLTWNHRQMMRGAYAGLSAALTPR